MSELILAVMQADTVMGRELIDLLRAVETPWFSELRLFSESDEDFIRLGDKDIPITPYSRERFDGVDIALLGDPSLVDAGAVTVNIASSDMTQDAPVVDPVLNPSAVDEHRGQIYVPDGPSLALARVIRACEPVESVASTVLQPASALGPHALEELYAQSRALFNHDPLPEEIIGGRLAFNILPGSSIHGIADLVRAPVHTTSFLVPVFGGTLLTASIQLEGSHSVTEASLNGRYGLEVFDTVEPADVVGDSAIRVSISKTSENSMHLVATVDEVRCVAQALCDTAREVVLQDAF